MGRTGIVREILQKGLWLIKFNSGFFLLSKSVFLSKIDNFERS